MSWVAPEVLIDFASDPLDPLDFSTATNVTQYVRSVSIDRGKQAEDEDHVQPGTATIVLENRDGRFDPNNGGSPYAPNVKPMKRVRVRATNPADSTVYDLFTGYIMSWPQQYVEGDAEVLTPIDCVDALTILDNVTLPESEFEHAMVKEGAPDHYWRLNEPDLEGISARDTGEAAKLFDGSYDGAVTPGAAGMVPNDPDTAATFPGAAGDVVTIDHPDAAVKGDANFGFTVVLAIKTTTGTGSVFLPVIFFNEGTRMLVQNDSSASPGAVRLFMDDPTNGSQSHNSSIAINDGNPHLLVWRQNPDGSADEGWDLFLDDSAGISSPRFAVFAPEKSLRQGIAGPPDSSEANSFIDATIQKVAVYNRAWTDQQVQALYWAWRELSAGDHATFRFNDIMNIVGWPTADRVTEASSSTFIAINTESRSALDYMHEVETSEAGLFAVNPSGQMRFTGRLSLYEDSLYNTAQSSWTEDGAGTTLDYESLSLDALSIDDVRNEVRIKRHGVSPITVSDEPSKTAYGVRSLDKGELLVDDDDQVRGAAEHYLNRQKDPAQRVKAMTINPTDDNAKWTQVLSRRLMERVHVKRSPDGGSWTAIDEDAHIIGISHEITQQSWQTTWRLSALDTATTYLILDHSTLGKLDENSLAW